MNVHTSQLSSVSLSVHGTLQMGNNLIPDAHFEGGFNRTSTCTCNKGST